MTTAPRANAPRSQQKSWWEKVHFGLGIAISLACLWLVTRQISWPQVLVTVQTADWGLLLLGCLLLLVTWMLFAVRWRVLLAPAKIPLADTFSYIMIGYLGNTILPLRLGDLGRIALISRKHDMNLGFTSATVLLERLFDVLTLVVLAGLLMAAVPVPALVRHTVRAAAAIALGAFVALALLSRSTFVLAGAQSFLSTHLSHRTLQPVLRLVRKFVEGLQTTRNVDQMLHVGFLSLLAWGIAGLSILCFVRSFELQVPWEAAFLVLTITNLGSAIPSSPGTVGLYEFLAMLALSTWTSDKDTVLGFATITHVVSLVLTVLLGLIAAWREGVRLSALASGNAATAEGPTEPAPPMLSAPACSEQDPLRDKATDD